MLPVNTGSAKDLISIPRGRLDYQPLFGKGARAPPPNSPGRPPVI